MELMKIGEIPTEQEESSLVDYFRVSNSIASPVLNPELYGANPKGGFDISQYKDVIQEQPVEVQRAMLGASSEEDMYNRMGRTHLYLDSHSRIEEDSAWIKYPTLLATGATDPLNFIPIGGAAMKSRALFNAHTNLSRMALTGAVTGSVGAVSNMASEAIFDIQGLPADYPSAAMFGLVLGGGFGAIAEGLSRTSFQSQFAKALTKEDEVIGSLEVDPALKSDGTYEVGPIPAHVDAMSYPAWAQSDTMKSWTSPLDSVRRVISRLSNPTLATKFKDGTIAPTDTTAKDMTVRWSGNLNKARTELASRWRDNKVDGKTNLDFDKWLESIGEGLHTKSSKQEIEVKKSDEYKTIISEFNSNRRALDKEYKAADDAVLEAYNIDIKGRTDEEIQAISAVYDAKRLELEASYRDKFEGIERDKDTKINKVYEGKMPELTPEEMYVKTYYDSMLDVGMSKEVDAPQLKGLSKDRLYITRQYNIPEIKKIPEAEVKGILKKGMEAHPDNAKMSPEQLDEAAGQLAINLKDLAFSTNYNDFSVFVPQEGFGSARFLKQRKIAVDSSYILPLLHSNVDDVMGMYHYWQKGQYAVRWAFPELRGVENKDLRKKFNEVYVEPVRLEAEAKGIDAAEDMKALNRVFDDISGVHRLPEHPHSFGWKVSRTLTAANAVTYSGMFGLNTMAEIPSALWATGFNRIFDKDFMRYFVDANRALFKKGKPNVPLMQELVHMGQLTSLLEVTGMNRLTDTEHIFNAGALENKLMGFTQSIYKWNGMRAMTATLEAVVGSNTIEMLRKMQGQTKFSKVEIERLSRFGLTPDEAKFLGKEIDRLSTKNKKGNVESLNLDKWDDAMLGRLQTAVNRAIESGVLQGDTMHLPDWMIKPGPLRRVLTQFLRYPITAQEVLLRKGMSEDMAGWSASAIGAMGIYMGMIYLIEQSEVGLGIRRESDTRYDITTEEGRMTAFLKALNYVSAFGAFMLPLDYGASAAQLPKIGRDYADRDVVGSLMGVSGARAKSMSDMLHGVITGEFTDERTLMATKNSFGVMINYPILGQAINSMIKD